MKTATWGALLSLCITSTPVLAIDLNIDDPASIKRAAKTVARGMLKYYTGYKPGDVPGNLPDPYFWWEAGAMFGGMVDYWYYTGDDEYNQIVTQALLHQTGPNKDYMPPNQTKTLGNDDQGFWGMSAMLAAENRYPDPPPDKPQWLALAQAVFQTQATRWNTETCGGGLKWQIFTFNKGYDYKNTISNGCFFNLAARLAKYTGNTTYAEWAEKSWDWMETIGFISKDYRFFDGAKDAATFNCTKVNPMQWTYNAGVSLYGAAAMWNFTKEEKWRTRVTRTLEGINVFFHPEAKNVMYEVTCEPNGKCNIDQRSFKAYLSRWLSATVQVAPFTRDTIMPKIRASAAAAAKACNDADDGAACSIRWTSGKFDGTTGVGENMAAMEIIQGLFATQAPGPVTNSTGGTSKGDPAAGTKTRNNPNEFDDITTADKAGAGILVTLVIAFILGGTYWMVVVGE